jgi:phosphoribosylformylglycinamidine synthase
MKAVINIYLKNGILDSQGKVVHKALDNLGFLDSVKDVRIGKQIIIELSETDKTKAETKVKKMCEQLLVNSVIEDYDIELG